MEFLYSCEEGRCDVGIGLIWYTYLMSAVLYLFLFILFFLSSIFFAIYFILLLYSALEGAPYVPTRGKDIMEILSHADLKPGQSFLELGCGDGRVTRTAVKQYQVKGTGIDVNQGLVLWARLKAWFQGLPNVRFIRENVKTISFDKRDVIYMFLLPNLIKTFAERLAVEVEPNTLVISHGFRVPQWAEHLEYTRKSPSFPTYYYRLRKTD